MDEQVRLSRLRVSRRRALVLGGTVGLAGVLAACATGSDAPSTGAVTATAPVTDPAALLDVANTCVLAQEETQGPYWFDVDSIRSDIREGRPGLTLALALRVHDLSSCSVGGAVRPVPNSVVEIWHCDAGGVYSGFATAATREPPPARPPAAPNLRGGQRSGGPPAGASSDGSYSSGDPEATPVGRRHLPARRAGRRRERGRAVHDDLPGLVPGPDTHIHCKVHLDRRTVLTTQLYFDDNLTEEIYREIPPYTEHTVRDTRNDTDSIYADVGLVTTQRSADGYLAAINLGLDL